MTKAAAPWARFVLMVAITAVVLVPVAVPVVLAQQQSARFGGVLAGLRAVFLDGPALAWFGNSLFVAGVTVAVSIAIGAPAGYVLSRARGRAVDAFALTVFAVQALPTVVLAIPLFILFVQLQLVDSLPGLAILYVGLTASIGTWTMAAAIDDVPVALEEAAWLDGASVLGGFVRVVMPNAVSGVLSTAVLTFLFAWNEYLLAVTFLSSESNFTVAEGVVGNRIAVLGIAAMLPPLVVFALLHRAFRFSGMSGSVKG